MQTKERYGIAVVKGELGGAQVIACNNAHNLKKQGKDIIVFSGPDGTYVKDFCKEHDIPFKEISYLVQTFNPFKMLFLVVNASVLFKNHSITSLEIHSSNGLFLGLSCKLLFSSIYTVFIFHGLSFLDDAHSLSFFKKKLLTYTFTFLLLFIDKAYAITDSNFEKIKKMKIIHDSKLELSIPYKPELDYKSKEESRTFFSQILKKDVSDKYIIGTIGRLAYPKNQEAIIRFLKDIRIINKNAIAIIIGEGPDRIKLEEIIEREGLEEYCFLIGEINNASRLLKGFDIFILPSHYEGRSISLMEARGADIKIIASDIPGNREVLDGYQNAELKSSF